MIATVQLTPEIEAEIIREATERAASRLLEDALLNRDEARTFLKVSIATLDRLPIKRAKIAGCTRYRRADLLAYVESTLER